MDVVEGAIRALCAERDRLRARRVHRGLGLCVFIDLTVPGAQIYGTGGARISSQDGTTIRLEPSGKLTVIASITGRTGICGAIEHVALGQCRYGPPANENEKLNDPPLDDPNDDT